MLRVNESCCSVECLDYIDVEQNRICWTGIQAAGDPLARFNKSKLVEVDV